MERAAGVFAADPSPPSPPTSTVFKWRRAKLDRRRPGRAGHQALLLPVVVDPQESFLPVSAPAPDRVAHKDGVIEVEIGGARLVMRGSVDPAAVRSVLMALRESA
jgi:transposase